MLRLVLDSSYTRLSDGTYGQAMDGANYKWNDLTYNLYDFLPPQVISRLLLGDRYRIVLEDLVWTDRVGFTTSVESNAFKIVLPGIQQESTFSNRGKDEPILEIVYEGYNPNVNFQTGKDYGITTYDKNWLRSGALRVRFGKIHADSDAFLNSDFGPVCKYVLTILIEGCSC